MQKKNFARPITYDDNEIPLSFNNAICGANSLTHNSITPYEQNVSRTEIT